MTDNASKWKLSRFLSRATKTPAESESSAASRTAWETVQFLRNKSFWFDEKCLFEKQMIFFENLASTGVWPPKILMSSKSSWFSNHCHFRIFNLGQSACIFHPNEQPSLTVRLLQFYHDANTEIPRSNGKGNFPTRRLVGNFPWKIMVRIKAF